MNLTDNNSHLFKHGNESTICVCMLRTWDWIFCSRLFTADESQLAFTVLEIWQWCLTNLHL